MKVWPFGAALRGRLQTATCCGSGNATVVSDVEKALLEVSGGDQEDERERITDDVSLFNFRWHQNREVLVRPGMSLAGARLLARWCPAWRRREPGLRLPRGTWEGAC